MKKLSALFIFAFILFYCNRAKDKNQDQSETTIVTEDQSYNTEYCYLKVIAKDSIILKFTRNKDSIFGKFDWKPFEKDKKISSFNGVVVNDTAKVLASYLAEGMKYSEELIFTFNPESAKVLYGEMTENEQGIWKYKDLKNSSFQLLPKVDCK